MYGILAYGLRTTKDWEMEIKLDRTTLPTDKQKIKWQTQQDVNKGTWKEGTFTEGDD